MDYRKAALSEIQFLVMQEVATLYPEHAIFDHADKGRFDMFDKVSGSNEIRERFVNVIAGKISATIGIKTWIVSANCQRNIIYTNRNE